MGRHSGKNGIVKHGANVLSGMTSWSITENHGTTPTTAAGDDWARHAKLHSSWSGSVTLNCDDSAGANQTLRAGDSVTLQLYSEGDGAGKTFYEGDVTITSAGKESPFDGTVTRTYEFEGNGPLDISTVAGG